MARKDINTFLEAINLETKQAIHAFIAPITGVEFSHPTIAQHITDFGKHDNSKGSGPNLNNRTTQSTVKSVKFRINHAIVILNAFRISQQVQLE